MNEPVNAPRSIMVVDDELDILLVLEKYLAKLGFNVLAANSGEKALKGLKENSVDLVLLDVAMPYMSGLDVLKEIKRIKPKTQTMMMTAYESEEKISEAFQLGACECILKPFNLNVLRERISAILAPPPHPLS